MEFLGESSCRSWLEAFVLRILRRVQVLVGGYLEEEKFVPPGIGNPCNVDVGATQRRIEIAHVKVQKSRLGRVRLDLPGGKLRRLDLVHFFFADGSLHFPR